MSEKETQDEIDATQAHLEEKVAQLKELVMDKVEAVEEPLVWLRDNAWKVLLGAGAAFLLYSLMRPRDRAPTL